MPSTLFASPQEQLDVLTKLVEDGRVDAIVRSDTEELLARMQAIRDERLVAPVLRPCVESTDLATFVGQLWDLIGQQHPTGPGIAANAQLSQTYIGRQKNTWAPVDFGSYANGVMADDLNRRRLVGLEVLFAALHSPKWVEAILAEVAPGVRMGELRVDRTKILGLVRDDDGRLCLRTYSMFDAPEGVAVALVQQLRGPGHRRSAPNC